MGSCKRNTFTNSKKSRSRRRELNKIVNSHARYQVAKFFHSLSLFFLRWRIPEGETKQSEKELPASKAYRQPLTFPWSEDTTRCEGRRQWLLKSRRRASHTQYVRPGGATRLSASDDSSNSTRQKGSKRGYKRYLKRRKQWSRIREGGGV